jgi:hypothetical protein
MGFVKIKTVTISVHHPHKNFIVSLKIKIKIELEIRLIRVMGRWLTSYGAPQSQQVAWGQKRNFGAGFIQSAK